MSTPNLTNQDNVGNYYFGWRSNLFVNDSRAENISQTTLRDWINTSLGQTCAVISSSNTMGLLLPSLSETIARPALIGSNNNPSTTGNRFRIGSSLSSSNTASSQEVATVSYNSPAANQSWFFDIPDSTQLQYWCLNTESLAMFSIGRNGNTFNSSSYRFFYYGWLKNPLYSGSFAPLNFVYLILGETNTFRTGARIASINSNTRTALRVPTASSADSIANYSITCQTSTPGANTTDLVIRDDASPNRAIGVASNLLKTSLAIPVGQIYRNTGTDPDGSNNQFWICVGEFGSERILMRVWTQGLT
jgi:hypothetical protein